MIHSLNRLKLPEMVSVYLVPAFPVEPEPVPGRGPPWLVSPHDFDQTLESREVSRSIVAEVYEDLVMRRGVGIGRDQHRRVGGQSIVHHAVRQESGRRRGPEHAVDISRNLGIWRIDQHPQLLLSGLRREPACDLKPVSGVVIEVDARQAYFPLRPMRNVLSSGTGRPVAPLFFPDSHAVPAMSRCAHP